MTSFIEVAPLSTEISRHALQDGQRTDGQPDGIPEHIMPPLRIVGGGINIKPFYTNDHGQNFTYGLAGVSSPNDLR